MKAPITAPKALVPTITGGVCAGTSRADACDPSRTITGADNRSYRVDTYLYYDTPAGGQQLRSITVVVRDPSPDEPLARAHHVDVRLVDGPVAAAGSRGLPRTAARARRLTKSGSDQFRTPGLISCTDLART